MLDFVPRKIFFVKGVGVHKEKLESFEMALRDAGVQQFNLVRVSSIFPPGCEIVSKQKGLLELKPGQIVFCVMSENSSNEPNRLMAAGVGLALPADKNHYGYLSEHHSYGQTDEEAGEYAEDLAASMLASTLGVTLPSDNLCWDDKEQAYKISGKIVKTCNFTQSYVGTKGPDWVTVLAAAIFVP
ncbi:MAG: arginine decarboxylase, pyruvoyl-dependent [Candidatus Diapherotrites archaeon]|nr:arginine decarboxylase, pyruvoyl-dependent [Candidatus Diapherotrites archaeon]